MPMDYETQVSTAQALTGTSAILSEDSYDLGAAGSEAGAGRRVDGVVIPSAVGGTSPTLQVDVVESANADLSSPTVLARIPAQTPVVGQPIRVTIPPGVVTKRYIGFQYTPGGTSPTSTLDAWIGGNVETAP